MNREERERTGIRSGRTHLPGTRIHRGSKYLMVGQWVTWTHAPEYFCQITDVHDSWIQVHDPTGRWYREGRTVTVDFRDHITRDDGQQYDRTGQPSNMTQWRRDADNRNRAYESRG